MTEYKDYYEILGVTRTATPEEIRSAFRKKAREYHPDVAKDKVQGAEKFKEVNEAYEVLSDPAKRAKYDQMGREVPGQGFGWPSGPGGAGAPDMEEFHFGGTGYSDFFEHLFGGIGGSGGFRGPSGRRMARRGSDIEGDLMVTLEEALRGATREVTLQRGEGKTETYRVKIPSGVREGQRIRLPGKGESGRSGGGSGDLYLRVRLARHPDLRVEGSDLFADLEVAPWEAVLGASVAVPTLEGMVMLKVPAGSTAGQKLRLRGQGLPREDGSRGDLYALLEIAVPPEVSPGEKELWEKLARESRWRPGGRS
ncbi:MAG: J domain-containing protein [Verrucomicrobia bacterium]|nr:J domain-containing protein [Verrucomicrobiota bacterium]NBU69112.1 J domain-containing protein [Verrucomicrobiota bacterium]